MGVVLNGVSQMTHTFLIQKSLAPIVYNSHLIPEILLNTYSGWSWAIFVLIFYCDITYTLALCEFEVCNFRCWSDPSVYCNLEFFIGGSQNSAPWSSDTRLSLP